MNIVHNYVTGKFDVSVCILGKAKRIGSFDRLEEAEEMILSYRKEFINKFARKNRNKVPYMVYGAMMNWNTELVS